MNKILNINSLSYNKITSKGASLLFNALNECKLSVEIINLNYNQLDDDCMESLGKFIQNNQTIKNIDISNNKITDKGIEILFSYLFGNTTIKKFDIYDNKGITDKSIPLLLEIIQKSKIENISIYGTSIANKNTIVTPLVENILKNGSDKMNMSGK